MEWYWILIIFLVALIGLMISGVPVFLSFLIVNVVGSYVLWGGVEGIVNFTHTLFSSVSSFVFFPVPMFILMGDIIARSGVFVRVIDTLDMFVGRLRGRLIFLAIAAATVFAALSGSAQGTAAMLGSILLPEMYKRGYAKPLAVGACFSGALAQLIPPSAFAVILGSLAQVSIGKLLIGGIIPGLLLAVIYALVVAIILKVKPGLAQDIVEKKYPFKTKVQALMKNVMPFGSIMFLVTGLVFLGICTPTESAVLGVVGSLIITACYRKLNFNLIIDSLRSTLSITGMMLLIVANAVGFSQLLAYTGVSREFCQFVMSANLSPLLAMLIAQGVYFVLGCFMEQASILMITLPIFLPVMKSLGIDILWFCVLVLMNMGIAMKSPPFGLTLFVMQGVVPEGTTLRDIYLGAWLFILCDAVGLLIVLFFPQLALLLPNLMR